MFILMFYVVGGSHVKMEDLLMAEQDWEMYD